MQLLRSAFFSLDDCDETDNPASNLRFAILLIFYPRLKYFHSIAMVCGGASTKLVIAPPIDYISSS